MSNSRLKLKIGVGSMLTLSGIPEILNHLSGLAVGLAGDAFP